MYITLIILNVYLTFTTGGEIILTLRVIVHMDTLDHSHKND